LKEYREGHRIPNPRTILSKKGEKVEDACEEAGDVPFQSPARRHAKPQVINPGAATAATHILIVDLDSSDDDEGAHEVEMQEDLPPQPQPDS